MMLARRHLLLSGLAVLMACDAEPPLLPLPQVRLADITLSTLDGGREPLAPLRGKVVLLNVWATWCAPCRSEMPALQRLADALDPSRFAVLGVAVDDNPVFPREYLRQAGLSFARHSDREQRVTQGLLGVSTLPQTLLFDRDGVARHRFEGDRDWGAPAMQVWLQRFRANPQAAGRPA